MLRVLMSEPVELSEEEYQHGQKRYAGPGDGGKRFRDQDVRNDNHRKTDGVSHEYRQDQ